MTLVILPALMVPGVGSDTRQIVVLFGLIAGALTLIEYSATYPSLVEFRYAPPFNRLRFLALALSVMALATVLRGQFAPTDLSLILEGVGSVVGRTLDFPYSPLRLLLLTLPDTATLEQVALMRSLAGLSLTACTVMVLVFLVTLRLGGWPTGREGFNVWVNLPTFDPTAGGDVVARLERDARFNVAFGLLLLFLIPAMLKLAAAAAGTLTLTGAQTLIWVVAAWAFLPASMIMRGAAMGRVARMIRDKRTELADTDAASAQTA